MDETKVINLGKQLVKELGLEKSTDTLSRWMAHHIAELIDKSDSNKDQERNQIKSDCMESILKLWKHRAYLPNGKRPFENIEPLLNTIDSISLNNQTPHYFRDTISYVQNELSVFDTSDIKHQIKSIDLTARILIEYLLRMFLEKNNKSQSINWSVFEEILQSEDILLIKISRKFENDDQHKMNEDISKQITLLDNFIEMSECIRKSLEQKLK